MELLLQATSNDYTNTSLSSNEEGDQNHTFSLSYILNNNDQKKCSPAGSPDFKQTLTVTNVEKRKRPRRKYAEMVRIYKCNYPGCVKSYGFLNHLNEHIQNNNHGPKRKAKEFREIINRLKSIRSKTGSAWSNSEQMDGLIYGIDETNFTPIRNYQSHDNHVYLNARNITMKHM